MNRRLLSVFLFALVVSALASFAVYYLVVTNVEAASKKPRKTRRILVAARTLEVGTLIRESDLRWSNSAEPPASNTVNEMEQATGRGVIATVYEGEPIASGRLAPSGAGAGLAALIPPGKRAVALKIDEVVGVAGFVVPGMRVDVLVSGSTPDNNRNGTQSRTILQNIEVLSAGQKIEKSADGKPQNAQVVNLLVTPNQAEILSLASSETKVQLVLRNPLDTREEKTQGTSIAALFGATINQAAPQKTVVTRRIAQQKPAIVSVPSQATVEVFNGVKRSEQTFEAHP